MDRQLKKQVSLNFWLQAKRAEEMMAVAFQRILDEGYTETPGTGIWTSPDGMTEIHLD